MLLNHQKDCFRLFKEHDYQTISIGKIDDIFDNEGITRNLKTSNNLDGINTLINMIDEDFTGLCFINLNDFDSKYGHRRNIIGYAKV